MQEQDGQQGARFAGRKLQQASVPGDLERPEDAELERLAHTHSRRSTGVNRSSTDDRDALSQLKNLGRKEMSCSLRFATQPVSQRS